MSRRKGPAIEGWYEDLETGRRFEVVDVDEDNGVVEVEYLDGEMEEIELDAWYDLDLERVEGPEGDEALLDEIEPEGDWGEDLDDEDDDEDDYGDWGDEDEDR